jgi:hypothetical protein
MELERLIAQSEEFAVHLAGLSTIFTPCSAQVTSFPWHWQQQY